MAEQKKQAEEKKNLQVRVDQNYALLVAALAQARGHSTVADLIKELLDEALNDTRTRFDELKKQVQDRYAAKAQSEIEALEKIATETGVKGTATPVPVGAKSGNAAFSAVLATDDV